MNKRLHRINDNVLLRIYDTQETLEFWKIKDQINLTYNHYNDVLLSTENIIWDSGDYQQMINKLYDEFEKYTPEVIVESEVLRLSVLFSNVNWEETLFGYHMIVKDSITDEVLVSRRLTIDDVQIISDIEIISGVYWNSEVIVNIPKTDNILLVDIYPIEDIQSSGLLIGYTDDLIPLIDEKPIPDYIKTYLTLNNNHFLKIEPKTDENKTLYQSILDYFQQTYADIDLTHVISYGTTELGFKQLRVKNETDQYLPVIIGLDFSDYATEDNDSITIHVATEIVVDNKLIKREVSLITTLMEIINPLVEGKITHPDTNYPVDVTNQTIVNNTVIETKTEEKIIPILNPVFVEMIKDTIIFENKDISFDYITKHAVLSINDEQQIQTKLTSDGKYYFDLTELVPISEEKKYFIIDISSNKIIGEGIIKNE